ncbi:unnamed protein product [Paramecium primaurelia]|uniref:Uncharacterized protein n=1 Tax=Paramecium primaurelia TaxID=5886 RepID=A0A8S1QFI4_PARPR|nr:unnamed protein product [Paramecium primaurelia]
MQSGENVANQVKSKEHNKRQKRIRKNQKYYIRLYLKSFHFLFDLLILKVLRMQLQRSFQIHHNRRCQGRQSMQLNILIQLYLLLMLRL